MCPHYGGGVYFVLSHKGEFIIYGHQGGSELLPPPHSTHVLGDSQLIPAVGWSGKKRASGHKHGIFAPSSIALRWSFRVFQGCKDNHF